MIFHRDLRFAFVLSLLATCSSTAVAQHSDVLLADVGGQVAVGFAENIGDPNNESFSLGVGAFESIMIVGSGLIDPPDYESDEPGFYSDPNQMAALGASALPGFADVSASTTTFTIDGVSAELFYWDGTGPVVDFNPAPANTTFEFEPAAGFATTSGSGFVDGHPEFILEADPNAVPADGVYLISPVVDVDTLTTSDNFFVVLLVDALIANPGDAHEVEEALEAFEDGAPNAEVDFGGGNVKDFAFYEEAVEFVEDNLVVPEPTSGLIACVALGLVAVSRNRTVKS